MINPKLTLGKKLKALRLAKGLTLRELAEEVKEPDFKVDFTYLSKIENDKTEYLPSVKLLEKLAKALDADANELVALAGKVPPRLKEYLKKASSEEILTFLRGLPKK